MQPRYSDADTKGHATARTRNSFALVRIRYCAKTIAVSYRARSVFTVTLQFDFLLIVRVRTIVAAVRFEGRYLAVAPLVRAFTLTAYVQNFGHDAPQFSECGFG